MADMIQDPLGPEVWNDPARRGGGHLGRHGARVVTTYTDLCAGWAALRRRAAEACGQPVDNLWITCGKPSGCQTKPYDNTLSNRVAEVSHAYDNMHDLTPETGQKTTKTARKQPGKQPGNRTRSSAPIGGPG